MMQADPHLCGHASVSDAFVVDGVRWRYELNRSGIVRFRRVGTPDRDISAAAYRAPTGRWIVDTDKPHAGDTLTEALERAIRNLPPKR